MHPICLHFIDWLKKNLTTFWEITNDTVASYFDPIYDEQQSMLLCYTRNKSTHYFFLNLRLPHGNHSTIRDWLSVY